MASKGSCNPSKKRNLALGLSGRELQFFKTVGQAKLRLNTGERIFCTDRKQHGHRDSTFPRQEPSK